MRCLIVAFALICAPAGAFALEAKDLVGRWSSEWASAPGEQSNGSADVYITADADESDRLDGAWDVPGMNGVMNGVVERGENGVLIWSGRWAPPLAGPDSGGTFRLVFENARSFSGVWSADGGGAQDAPWTGRRR